jgi:type I restriction enzyme R subunit
MLHGSDWKNAVGNGKRTLFALCAASYESTEIRDDVALAAKESAVKAMGDDKLKVIAAELITQVRRSVTIDWTLREGTRAKIRVIVKRILNKYGYPPDLQDEAVKTVLRQAELLCVEWA